MTWSGLVRTGVDGLFRFKRRLIGCYRGCHFLFMIWIIIIIFWVAVSLVGFICGWMGGSGSSSSSSVLWFMSMTASMIADFKLSSILFFNMRSKVFVVYVILMVVFYGVCRNHGYWILFDWMISTFWMSWMYHWPWGVSSATKLEFACILMFLVPWMLWRVLVILTRWPICLPLEGCGRGILSRVLWKWFCWIWRRCIWNVRSWICLK